jgi:GH25 family lysozyme M1 (1,4-beta-N-acetylmuramidase)
LIKFIDLYSDNDFKPAELIAQGYVGVIFKAGQGGWADVSRVHPEWWELANSYGLKRGWYWLCDSRYRTATHIACMKSIGIFQDVGELGLWIDMEKPRITMTEADYYKTPYAGYKQVIDFAYLIRLEGVEPGIYTGPGAYELITRGAPKSAHDYLAKSKLWTAQYPWKYEEGVSRPSLYGSWKEWEWWQYREGPDVNIYSGTKEQFELDYGDISVELPEVPPIVVIPPELGETMKGKVKVGTIVNIKNMAGGSAPVAVMQANDFVYGTDSPTDIINFSHYYLANGTKVELSAVCKASKTNLIVTNEAEPTIPVDPPVDPPTDTSHVVEVFIDGVSVYRTELD